MVTGTYMFLISISVYYFDIAKLDGLLEFNNESAWQCLPFPVGIIIPTEDQSIDQDVIDHEEQSINKNVLSYEENSIDKEILGYEEQRIDQDMHGHEEQSIDKDVIGHEEQSINKKNLRLT